MPSRRQFIKTIATGAAGAAILPSTALAAGEQQLVILHTNDTHSRIDPFPIDGGRNQGLGGVARRAALVEQIRRQHPHVLLLDSGDIFQGTPYFNLFDGELEFRSMSAMRYDYATIGNHDFDNGVDGLVKVLPHAEFGFVSSNYRVEGTPLAETVRPFVVRQMGNIRVGIFGLGIDFDRLVLPSLHEGVEYEDPVGVAREMVQELRGRGCHFIVCLSHLGHAYGDGRISDRSLAPQVPGIDLILGGHTHTFMERPDEVVHEHDRPVLIHQVGFAGIRLGRVDVRFDRAGRVRGVSCSPILIDHRFDAA
jgi:5'-nucleotidase